jgi:DDE superfamily endonuclease
MLPLPEGIIAVVGRFGPLFRQPVWCHVRVLVVGAWLCQGARTVTAVLRVRGLKGEKRFGTYHRVLSRAHWSGLVGARILLGMLVALLASGWPVLVGIDETIERRRGRKIQAKGVYRDAVRSTEKHVVKCLGLKWISMMLLVPLPWSSRPWALPFLTVLAPSRAANEKASKPHRTTVDWAWRLARLGSRWLDRPWVLSGDGAYACVRFAQGCQRQGVTLVARLRLDAVLYDCPRPVPARRRGRRPKTGQRQPSWKARASQAGAAGWTLTEVRWDAGERKRLWLSTGVSLWYRSGLAPLPIRWVLIVDPQGQARTEALFSTDVSLAAETIVAWFVLRWNVEVTFEESRRHRGVETQRQWSDLAIARTTPVLLGLFSLVCLMAHRLLATDALPLQSTAWYAKSEATFSDILAWVRRTVWACRHFNVSHSEAEPVILPRDQWDTLLDQLASAA